MLTLTPSLHPSPHFRSHGGPGRDEQPGSEQESHQVWVGQPTSWGSPDLQTEWRPLIGPDHRDTGL